MQGSFTAVYDRREDWIVAYVLELPGVNTQGRTMAEARRNLREALQLILDANRELAEQEAGPDAIRETLVLGDPA